MFESNKNETCIFQRHGVDMNLSISTLRSTRLYWELAHQIYIWKSTVRDSELRVWLPQRTREMTPSIYNLDPSKKPKIDWGNIPLSSIYRALNFFLLVPFLFECHFFFPPSPFALCACFSSSTLKTLTACKDDNKEDKFNTASLCCTFQRFQCKINVNFTLFTSRISLLFAASTLLRTLSNCCFSWSPMPDPSTTGRNWEKQLQITFRGIFTQ